MKSTYTKLNDGTWGVRVVGKPGPINGGFETPPSPGISLEVTTKGGKVRPETLKTRVWDGIDKETGEPVSLWSVVGRENGSAWEEAGRGKSDTAQEAAGRYTGTDTVTIPRFVLNDLTANVAALKVELSLLSSRLEAIQASLGRENR